MNDTKSKTIEKIKSTLIDLIQNKNNNIKDNFSVFLKEKIQQDYSTLSNLFSQIEGISIGDSLLDYMSQEEIESNLVFVYEDLDKRFSSSKFLAGENYTIADIATWPWIARHEWHDIGLNNYKSLTRWYLDISKREAVIKGYDLYKIGSQIPKI